MADAPGLGRWRVGDGAHDVFHVEDWLADDGELWECPAPHLPVSEAASTSRPAPGLLHPRGVSACAGCG